MCESNAYLKKDGAEELIMEDVARIQPDGEGNLILYGILGERKTVRAQIEEVDLMGHRIILAERE